MRSARRVLILLLVLLTAPCSVALAGGFEFPENLTRAMGRGGAWIAGVDDASALYLNPGALTRIEQGSLLLNLNIIDYQLTFQRETVPADPSNPLSEPQSFLPVENQSRPYLAPMVFGGGRIGSTNLVVAGGVYGPSSVGRLRFPDPRSGSDSNPDEPVDGGQRYMIIDQDVLLFYPSLAAAWRFDSLNLSVGFTGQLAFAIVDYNIAIDGSHSNPTRDGTVDDFLETETYLSRTRLEVSGMSPAMNMGVLWEPSPRFALGASWRPRFTLVKSGTIDVEFPEGLREALAATGDLAVLSNDVELEINFPHVVRFGALYRHLAAEEREVFNVELASVYEGWSVLEEYLVRTDVVIRLPDVNRPGNSFERELIDLRLPKRYQDSVSFRLGGEVHAMHYNPQTPRLSFRGGGFFETAATRDAYAHLDFLSPQRVGTSVGATWNVLHDSGAISAIDLGFSMIFSPDTVVENGRYDLLVPLWICNSPQTDTERERCAEISPEQAPGVGRPVNQGTFTSHMNIFSIGLSHRW